MTDETTTTPENADDKPTPRPRTRSRTDRSAAAPAEESTATGGEDDAAPKRRTRTRSAAKPEAAAKAARKPAAKPAATSKAKAKARAGDPEPGSADEFAEEASAPPEQPPARKRTSRPRKATAPRAPRDAEAPVEPDPEPADEQPADEQSAAAPAEDGVEVIPAAEAVEEAEESQAADATAPAARDTDTDSDSEQQAAAPGTDTDADADTGTEPAATPEDEAGAETAGSADAEAPVIRRRRRRRGGRRGGRSRSSAGRASADADADADVDADAASGDAGEQGARSEASPPQRAKKGKSAAAREDGTGEETESDDRTAEQEDEDSGGQGKGTTRLQARNRGRGRSSGRSRSGKGGRRPVGGVSEETRRAITEGPPRRMLVNMGRERTQVAVLEERTLVEHYVTRKEDVSYVGNIYLGRVQNVLPGMEAAFVDIGKGRNGVLYAGEVNYDEADLEGELPRIEDHLKPGQTVLVQVTKDPMGTKGARLTQHLSIAGRYCVLAPGDGMLGISRKLTDEERDRLRKVLKSIKPDGFGLIVRTAAEGATQEQLEADVSRLTRLWDQVQEKAKEVKPLDPVYEEPNLVMRVIRDVFGTEFSDLVVDSEELAERIRAYLSDVSPEMVDKVEVHSGEEPIFDAYEVTNQVRRALEKKVWLKSGGYLIIEKTEAMWVIDVNTGKFVGKDNLEETVLKNNLEAADEIARQLRLRDMGGIIVIDFVDMLVPANRDEVLKRFKRELARDKTKSRVMDISKLGLVQMTRKNVSQGLTETFTTVCDVCEGRGAQILDHAFH